MSNQPHIWNEGTTQEFRSVKALSDEYFLVDERFFDVLVNSVTEFAANISYFSNSLFPDGTWQQLIQADEIVVLAQLRLLDIPKIENRFYHYYHQFKPDQSAESNTLMLQKAFEISNDLHKKLEDWLKILQLISTESDHYPIFQEWYMALKEIRTLKKENFSTDSNLEAQYAALDEFFKILIKTTFFLNAQYDKFLLLAKGHQSHQPQNALLFVFIELMEHARHAINTFHKRHRDYYYKQHLRLSPKTAAPDSTFLTFELQEDATPVAIPAHTKMIAGQDNSGNDLIYETTDNLIIDQSKIALIRGVYISREKKANKTTHVNQILAAEYGQKTHSQPWSILNIQQQAMGNYIHQPEVGFILSSPNFLLREGIRTIKLELHGDIRYFELKPSYISESVINPEDIKISEIVDALKDANKSTSYSSLFNNAFRLTDQPSGFCISEDFVSKILEINAGEYAQQNLEDQLKNKVDLTLKEFIESLSQESKVSFNRTLWHTIRELTGETDNNLMERKLRKIFNSSLDVSYTTSNGWHAIKPLSVALLQDIAQQKYTVEIILILDKATPPLEINPNTAFKHPSIKFTLANNASLYGYDFFDKIYIDRISCHLNIEGIRTLSLYNQISQLDANSPFMPFGATPNHSSYLIIGNKEIFQKRFSKLRINVEWMDLPTLREGFKEYYKDYPQAINNQSFKTEVTILNDGNWLPKKEEREKIDLFSGKKQIEVETNYQIDTKKLSPSEDYLWNPETLEYSNNSSRGFLKLQLTDPEHSFGHNIYPNLISKSALENAKKMSGVLAAFSKKNAEMSLPVPPYTPKINKLTLDYKVSFEFALNTQKDHQFYHAYPFGGYHLSPHSEIGYRLVPAFRQEGILYIGIENFKPPGVLTLFFNLKEKQNARDAIEFNTVFWDYLQKNQWVRFKEYEVSANSTDHFLHSGIVKLEIPFSKYEGSSILDERLFWIRASALDNTHILGDVIDITLHTVEATYKAENDEQPANFKVDALTISESTTELSNIKSIRQPLASTGGRTPEKEEHFHLRVSERLRHKNRCVNLYDYERILLEAFPEINKAFCINAYNYEKNCPENGRVLIVVVPKISDQNIDSITHPTASIKTLREIRKYLASKASPFVKLDVINPEYEPMRVYANVKVAKGHGAGNSLKTLNRELKEFVAPWIKDPLADPSFQRNVTLEELQSFIQSRPYVEFVTKVSATKVDKKYDHKGREVSYRLNDTGLNHDSDNETKGQYPWSIITTAKTHQIILIEKDVFEQPDHAGLEELYLDEDFVIRKNEES